MRSLHPFSLAEPLVVSSVIRAATVFVVFSFLEQSKAAQQWILPASSRSLVIPAHAIYIVGIQKERPKYDGEILLGSLKIILERISEIFARLVKVLNVIALSTSHQR